jgi:hypothetical protein
MSGYVTTKRKNRSLIDEFVKNCLFCREILHKGQKQHKVGSLQAAFVEIPSRPVPRSSRPLQESTEPSLHFSTGGRRRTRLRDSVRHTGGDWQRARHHMRADRQRRTGRNASFGEGRNWKLQGMTSKLSAPVGLTGTLASIMEMQLAADNCLGLRF